MSFRLFIYYCTLCGGAAALIGWAVGRGVIPESPLLREGTRGMYLGTLVAFALGLVDAACDLTLRRLGLVFLRVLVAVLVGSVGGLIGGMVGQALYRQTEQPLLQSIFLILGWTITGLLIGVSIGVFEFCTGLGNKQNLRGARRKIVNGLLGGTLGGLLGGILSVLIRSAWSGVFNDKPAEQLSSPSAMGFTALGGCIGLLIGLARVFLVEAWISVETGFRAGREMILSKGETIIGRAEKSDVGLFGDAAVEATHARIVLENNRYLLSDAGTRGGTFLNDTRLSQPQPLQSGDRIRVGNCVLRFGERQKHPRA